MAEDPEQPADDFGQYLIATPYRGRASGLPWLALPEERSGGGVVSHPFPSGPRGGSVAIGTSANVSEIAKLEAQIAVLLDERLANLATIKALKIEAERRDTAFASSNSPRWTEMSRALGSHGSGKGEGRSEAPSRVRGTFEEQSDALLEIAEAITSYMGTKSRELLLDASAHPAPNSAPGTPQRVAPIRLGDERGALAAAEAQVRRLQLECAALRERSSQLEDLCAEMERYARTVQQSHTGKIPASSFQPAAARSLFGTGSTRLDGVSSAPDFSASEVTGLCEEVARALRCTSGVTAAGASDGLGEPGETSASGGRAASFGWVTVEEAMRGAVAEAAQAAEQLQAVRAALRRGEQERATLRADARGAREDLARANVLLGEARRGLLSATACGSPATDGASGEAGMEALVLSMEAPAEGVAETLLALLVRRVPPILEALGMSGAETVLCGEPVEAERLLDEAAALAGVLGAEMQALRSRTEALASELNAADGARASSEQRLAALCAQAGAEVEARTAGAEAFRRAAAEQLAEAAARRTAEDASFEQLLAFALRALLHLAHQFVARAEALHIAYRMQARVFAAWESAVIGRLDVVLDYLKGLAEPRHAVPGPDDAFRAGSGARGSAGEPFVTLKSRGRPAGDRQSACALGTSSPRSLRAVVFALVACGRLRRLAALGAVRGSWDSQGGGGWVDWGAPGLSLEHVCRRVAGLQLAGPEHPSVAGLDLKGFLWLLAARPAEMGADGFPLAPPPGGLATRDRPGWPLVGGTASGTIAAPRAAEVEARRRARSAYSCVGRALALAGEVEHAIGVLQTRVAEMGEEVTTAEEALQAMGQRRDELVKSLQKSQERERALRHQMDALEEQIARSVPSEDLRRLQGKLAAAESARDVAEHRQRVAQRSVEEVARSGAMAGSAVSAAEAAGAEQLRAQLRESEDRAVAAERRLAIAVDHVRRQEAELRNAQEHHFANIRAAHPPRAPRPVVNGLARHAASAKGEAEPAREEAEGEATASRSGSVDPPPPSRAPHSGAAGSAAGPDWWPDERRQRDKGAGVCERGREGALTAAPWEQRGLWGVGDLPGGLARRTMSQADRGMSGSDALSERSLGSALSSEVGSGLSTRALLDFIHTLESEG